MQNWWDYFSRMKRISLGTYRIQVENQKYEFWEDKMWLGEISKTCRILTILEYTERATIQYMTKTGTYLRHQFQGASIQTNTKRKKRYYMRGFEGTKRYQNMVAKWRSCDSIALDIIKYYHITSNQYKTTWPKGLIMNKLSMDGEPYATNTEFNNISWTSYISLIR